MSSNHDNTLSLTAIYHAKTLMKHFVAHTL